MAKTYRIHPAIGIARVGNSPQEFFIGPEKPGETVSTDSLPAGGIKEFRYKDAGFRIKRQAARFRIFEYGDDGLVVKEITLKNTEVESITWTVELANTKTWFRNGSSNPKLKIVPGAVSVAAPGVGVPMVHQFAADSPRFKGKKVTLGEARSEKETGRLIVLGGLGGSDSDPGGANIINFDSNPDWHDDVADGPVKATIKFKGTATPVEAVGAWVAVGPPDFAPPINSVVTLYDLLFQQALERGVFKKPVQVSFVDDIFPILNRAFDVRWLTGVATNQGAHTSFNIAATDAGAAKILCDDSHIFVRQNIYQRLRNPDPVKFPGFSGDMPFLMGTNAAGGESTDTFTLTPFQYEMMVAWATKAEGAAPDKLVGWVTDSLGKQASVPEQLDRAALEPCVGGAFFPGLEVSKRIQDKSIYMEKEAFRLDQSKLAPGDLTKDMALPWQGDFQSCRRHPDIAQDVPWWPSHRPDDVFPETDPNLTTQAAWVRDIIQFPNPPDATRRLDRLTMNARWHLLGFVTKRDGEYPETERNPTIKWLTPSLEFKDVPEGYGTSRPIDIEVRSSLKISFKVKGPTLPANFSLDKTEIMVEPTGPSEFKKIRFWVTYQNGTAGQSLSDAVTIEASQADGPCAEDYCLLGQQQIGMKASTVKRQTSATMLVLDRSGSMNETVLGEQQQQKINVLRSAAKTFVELALKDDGIGIVGYNDAAKVLSEIKKIGTEGNDQAREALKTIIDSDALEPSGQTSIGSGLVAASDPIKKTDKNEYPLSAFVVLTDGKENHGPYIDGPEVSAALSSSGTSKRIYAVGLGQPDDINQESLDKLTGSSAEHKGALLITGDLSTSGDQFRLQKYFVQILAGVNNTEIVLDPHGEIAFGSERRIPFHMTEADRGMDAILLSTSPRALDFRLENPSGHIIGTGQPLQIPALKYVIGDGLSFYRLFFPSSAAAGDRTGLWHAVLRYGDTGQGGGAPNIGKMNASGVARIDYSLVVHAYSNLRLKASARQEGYTPGAEVLLRASITEYDIPVETGARVWAEITDPRGERSEIALAQVEPGQFAARLRTTREGVYQARIRVKGTTLQGAVFSREQTLTPSVSHAGDRRHTDGRRGCLPRLFYRLLRG